MIRTPGYSIGSFEYHPLVLPMDRALVELQLHHSLRFGTDAWTVAASVFSALIYIATSSESDPPSEVLATLLVNPASDHRLGRFRGVVDRIPRLACMASL